MLHWQLSLSINLKEEIAMLKRILKLITEWIATNNLEELIADHFSLEDNRLLELFIFLAQKLILLPCLEVMQHMFIWIGQSMSPQKFTKPMFRVVFAFAWYMVAPIWIIPIYITLAEIIYMKRGIDTFFSLLVDFSLIFLIASFCTVILFLLDRKVPSLEEWADLKWGKSSQSYLDFCDRSISTLKLGLIFSISFSSIPLMVAALQL